MTTTTTDTTDTTTTGYWVVEQDHPGDAQHYPHATSAAEAAKLFGDDYPDDDRGTETHWIRVWVWPGTEDEDAADEHTAAVDPPEPDCPEIDHDWCSPTWLGGCEENPGVWGHGGGVIYREVCRHCGAYRVTDTWAQDPETGEQGLTSVTYEEPDDASLAWVEE